MTPEELKNSILQLAIEGKLVEQRPEEGTAKELYQQIRTEKKRLIKAGKIKNEKPLPEITEDEISIDIPENWIWIRLADITSELTLNDGNWVLSDDMVPIGPVKLIQLGSIGNCKYVDKGFKYLSQDHFHELNGRQIFGGYLLVNRLIGDKMLCCILPELDGTLMTTVDTCWISPQVAFYDIKYLMYVLASGDFQEKVKAQGRGTTRFRISKLNLISIAFPLPPLKEQKRIVAKIEELMPYINRYGQAWSKLEDFNKRFPTDMQKSILQMAIQGKLVEQRLEEGTGLDLYKQIQAEKQQLIEAGKIKKEKPLLEITEDEKPFDIPDSWKWVRVGSIVNIVSARRVHQSDWKMDGIPFYRAREIAKLASDGFVDNELFISKELFDDFSKSGVPHPGDLMVTAVGTLGKTYIVEEGDKFYYKDASVICLENYAHISPKYLKYIMQSEMLMNQIRSNSNGTTVATLTMVRMVEYLVPLPPLDEQKRIVAKLEEILPLCDKLKK